MSATDDLFAAIHAGLCVDDDAVLVDVAARVGAALAAGADWRAPRAAQGVNAAVACAMARRPALLRALLDADVVGGVAVDEGAPGPQLIHIAADHGRGDTVRMLVERGVAVDVRDLDGARPLDAAMSCSHSSGEAVDVVLDLMIAQGCAPIPAGRGTDLHVVAARACYVDACRGLSDDDAALFVRLLERQFIQCAGLRSVDLLQRFARSHRALLPALVALIGGASTLKRKPKAIAAPVAKKTFTGTPLKLCHVGDVVVDASVRVDVLVVVGDLDVDGDLVVVDGGVCVVGGAVRARRV